jgi:hypothetical protein
MFKSRLLSVLVISFFALSSLSSLAANSEGETSEITASDWQEKDKELETWCKQNPLVSETKFFPETRENAIKIRADFCNKRIANDFELQTRIVNLLGDLDRLFQSNIHLEMHSQEMSRIRSTGEVAQLEVLTDPILAVSLDHPKYYKIEGSDLAACDNAARSISPDTNSDCQAALKDFEVIYDFAQGTLSQPIAFELSKRLTVLEAEWTDFFDESKSQTVWEMAINGYFFQRDNEEHRFSEPPSWQLVFMHPRIVVENVKQAVDGQQLKSAIMVELAGVDWWRQDRWYLPSGGSVVTTYSDRSELEDWRWGIALNFASQFTLGASTRDGDTGVFITVDLLKLIQDKASILEFYRGTVDF